ncbi:uncharacterized protein METZ01_LOCUS355438, partial [marine metagenome]
MAYEAPASTLPTLNSDINNTLRSTGAAAS